MTINQDSFGNTYFGYLKPNDDGVPMGAGLPFQNFITAAYGSNSYWTADGLVFRILLPSPLEPYKTLPATNTNCRFIFSSNGSTSSINASVNSTTTNLVNISGHAIHTTSRFVYAIANHSSIVIADLGRTGGAFNGSFNLSYLGYLKNTAYPSVNNAVLGACGFRATNTTTPIANRPAALNTNTAQAIATSGAVANYSITCSINTPGANTSDLILRDNTGTNYAIGACHNVIKTTANISIGQIYSLNSDPDGNTEQTKWLCAGIWGTERLLMRVWTENII